MKLYFKNSQGKERVIAEEADKDSALRHIREFCSERGYTIPYVRQMFRGEEIHYDVGSHTEFFILKEPEAVETDGESS